MKTRGAITHEFPESPALRKSLGRSQQSRTCFKDFVKLYPFAASARLFES